MKKKRIGIRLLCCLLCCMVLLSACTKTDPTMGATTQEPKDAIYSITVKTAGGMIFEGMVAYVYEDNTEEDLLTYGTLDSNGNFTFTAPKSDKYTVRFANVPAEGYDLQEYYPITDTNLEILLTSAVITDKDALEAGKTYHVGDVMRDFTVSTVDGQELKLSEILKDKEAVVLNFWYTGCDPCKAEFPLLQEAYAAYSDRIEVITMNPTDISGDTAEDIAQFRDQYGLSMPMAMCTSQWFSALGIASYPTTVIIDRYGVICLLVSGSVTDDGVFQAAFEHFAAEDYQQKLLRDFSDLHVVEYPVGHEKNPYETYGAAEQFEVTVEPGAEFYTLIYKANHVLLHLEDPSAYVIYGENRYEPDKNGVIEFELISNDMMVGQSVIFGNTGVTAVTYQVQLTIAQGTYSNPYEGKLGENTVTVKEGNEQGVFYNWTAEADGVLTLTVTNDPSKDFDIQLYNLNTYAMRTLKEENLVDADGNRYVSVIVNKGDVVSIGYQSVPDSSNKYPKVTIQSVLSFTEGIEKEPLYNITVKDGEGNPMAGVSISVVVDGVNTVFVSDENGLIAMDLPAGMYTVKVTVPEGYECDTTQFLLTETNTSKDIVMHVYVPQEIPYTVYVVDENGNPVPNAAVVLGDFFAYTDAKGMVSVILLESKDYVATIVPPEGYTIDKKDHAFGANTVITVVVYQAPETQPESEYTVEIVDQDGNPYNNLLVRFDSEDGSISVTESVPATGKVKVMLPETNYTVTLVFTAANTMGYETTTAKLTAKNPSLKIQVVPYVTGESEMVFVNDADYEAIHVGMGSFYVDLTDVDIRFFLFTPEETGVYTFTTTNSNAAIGYWSTSFFAFDCSSEYVKDNVCTLEVKSVGPTYVISVKGGEGISGTVLKIKRNGDAQQDTTIYETYEGSTTPTAPFVADVTGSKNYLDLAVEQTLVKGADGFYHLGSADGPLVYMDLTHARFNISVSAVVNNSPMLKYEYDANGKPVKRIDYTPCMLSYVENADANLGVYALTDDLMTILQNHGEHAGWYDKDGQNYLFDGEEVLEGNGWMFLLCIFQ